MYIHILLLLMQGALALMPSMHHGQKFSGLVGPLWLALSPFDPKWASAVEEPRLVDCVKQCHAIFVVPLEKFKLDLLNPLDGKRTLNQLDAKRPPRSIKNVYGKIEIMEAVDSTPFVQIVPDLAGKPHDRSWVVFTKDAEDTESFKNALFKWWGGKCFEKDDRPSNVLICYKTHCINLQAGDKVENTEQQ